MVTIGYNLYQDTTYFSLLYVTILLVGEIMSNARRYEKIVRRLNTTNFFDYMEREQLTYNEMLGLIDFGFHLGSIKLSQKVYLKELLHQKQCCLKLADTKIGIISDTHIGSHKMNWDYIYMAYQLFEEEGIQSVLHLGDLFDGFLEQNFSDEREAHNNLMLHCYQQIIEYSKNYPAKFTTYTLLGNHDERIKKVGLHLDKQITARRDDIELLGYGGAYVSCNDVIFYLEHPVSCSTLVPPKFDYNLILRGHSHFFRYKEKVQTLHITSCSDINTCRGSINSFNDPGCAVISFDDDQYTIEGYTFQQKEVQKSLVLTLPKNR